MLRFGKELDESVAVVPVLLSCDEDEFNVYRETYGFIMVSLIKNNESII